MNANSKATTREQFRVVLRWVKEHPILGKSDNEVQKCDREKKKELWEKLTIELNELGPPVKNYQAWKRTLTDYKYSLRKKIQRRIAIDQDGSQILASLNDLENEALQVALLDIDFSDPDKIAFPDTPPEDSSMHQTVVEAEAPTPVAETPTTAIADNSDRNHIFDCAAQNNGHVQPESSVNVDQSALMKFAAIANGNANATITSGCLEAQLLDGQVEVKIETAEDLSKTSPNVSAAAYYGGDADMPEKSGTHDVADGADVKPPISENGIQSFPDIPGNPDLTAGMQHILIPNGAAAAAASDMDEYPDMSSVAPPFIESQPTQSLTTEEMNIIIAREIDRMAAVQKEGSDRPRKFPQRKRPDKPRKRPEETPPPQPKKIATTSENRPKKVAQKSAAQRSRVVSKPKIIKDIKNMKKVMSNREFRQKLLTLLTEANEMEKRRIAVTETKVRNQTEIQSLEITRMNLEIMKLQKEIILLEHGGKIFNVN